MKTPPIATKAFTLIELLTVIAIIAILMGLLFPALGGVKDSANKAKAKNDEMQIVNAVKAYYTEYGKYPILPSLNATGDAYTYLGNNDKLFNILRMITGLSGEQLDANPRQIVFIELPTAKDATNPKGGIGYSVGSGQFYDPWGTPYVIRIDCDYNNQIPNPYTANSGAGFDPINTGVIVWSAGKDMKEPLNSNSKGAGTKTFSSSDDVISWQ